MHPTLGAETIGMELKDSHNDSLLNSLVCLNERNNRIFNSIKSRDDSLIEKSVWVVHGIIAEIDCNLHVSTDTNNFWVCP